MSAAPIEDTTIDLPSGRAVAFTTRGDPAGRVVFYLHGTGHSRLFCPDPQGTSRAGVHLVAVGRPGYGGSDPRRGHTLADGARDLVAVADRLEIERFSVIGWSGGAGCAAALAAIADAAERVVGVAIVGPIRRRPRPGEHAAARPARHPVGHLGVVKRWSEVLTAIHPERCSPRTR